MRKKKSMGGSAHFINEVLAPICAKSIKGQLEAFVCNSLLNVSLMFIIEMNVMCGICKAFEYFDLSKYYILVIYDILRCLQIFWTFINISIKLHRFKKKYIRVQSFERRFELYTISSLIVALTSCVQMINMFHPINIVLSLISIIYFSITFHKEIKFIILFRHWLLEKKVIKYFALYLMVYTQSIIYHP